MASGNVPHALVKIALPMAARRLQRRQQPARHAGERGEAEPEREDGAVDADGSHSRQPGRTECDERAHTDRRDGHAGRAARGREQHAFGQESGHRRLPRPDDGDRVERPRSLQEPGVEREGAGVVAAIFQDYRDSVRHGVGQRLEKNRVDRAEHRGRRADAECQREHDQRREAGGDPELTRGVAHLGEGRADEALPSVNARLLADGRRRAELEPHRTARLSGRHAARHQRGDRLLEVVIHFVTDVLIGGAPPRQSANAVRQLPPERHRYPSFRNKRATAAARRVQPAVSTSSRFRPARLRV